MRFQFILSEIGIGLRRNLAMTISVILVTFVSLTFVGSAALLQLQISQMDAFHPRFGKDDDRVFRKFTEGVQVGERPGRKRDHYPDLETPLRL